MERFNSILILALIVFASLTISCQSDNVIDSFVTIDDGMVVPNISRSDKLNDQMDQFSSLVKQDSAKYAVLYGKALKINTASKQLVTHINKLKAKTIAVTDNLKFEEVYDEKADTVLGLRYVKIKDDYTVNTRILFGLKQEADPEMDVGVENPERYNYRVAHLKKMLIDYRELITDLLSNKKELVRGVNSIFKLEGLEDTDGNEVSWERMNFYHVPLAATTSILSKIQSDILAAESDAIGIIFNEINSQ